MLGSMVRLVLRPANKVARTNAEQAVSRLADRRRQREEADVYVARATASLQRTRAGSTEAAIAARLSYGGWIAPALGGGSL
jgi:hypothetical protein